MAVAVPCSPSGRVSLVPFLRLASPVPHRASGGAGMGFSRPVAGAAGKEIAHLSLIKPSRWGGFRGGVGKQAGASRGDVSLRTGRATNPPPLGGACRSHGLIEGLNFQTKLIYNYKPGQSGIHFIYITCVHFPFRSALF